VITIGHMAMRARLIRFGNSRGLRLPKALIESAGLSEWVDLRAEPGRLIVQAIRRPRAGWADAAKRMRAAGDDVLLDEVTPTRFDDETWKWG
jgi:antitoxin MazE